MAFDFAIRVVLSGDRIERLPLDLFFLLLLLLGMPARWLLKAVSPTRATAPLQVFVRRRRVDQMRFRPAWLRARYFCQTIQKYPKNLDAREGAGLRPVPCDARSRRGPQNSLRSLRSLRSDMLWPFFRLALRFSAPSRA